MEAIIVKKLNKSYGQKPVIKDLSFSVFQGEIVGLLGANGAGKSTTINILSTILKHDSRNVLIGGFDLMKDKAKTIFNSAMELLIFCSVLCFLWLGVPTLLKEEYRKENTNVGRNNHQT